MVVAETLYQGIDLTTMFWRKLLHTVNQKNTKYICHLFYKSWLIPTKFNRPVYRPERICRKVMQPKCFPSHLNNLFALPRKTQTLNLCFSENHNAEKLKLNIFYLSTIMIVMFYQHNILWL